MHATVALYRQGAVHLEVGYTCGAHAMNSLGQCSVQSPPVRGFPCRHSIELEELLILVIINPPTFACVSSGHRDFNATPPDERGGRDHQKWNPKSEN